MVSARILNLQRPNPHSDLVLDDRNSWIDEVCQGFVSPSSRNKEYYRVILETLWPIGHGIPGPTVTQDELRVAIDNFRRSTHLSNTPYKPYVDVFRRVRELQGEEGVLGVAKVGSVYQLLDLELSQKRIPRTKLHGGAWENVLKVYNYQCAVCGRKEPDVKFDQDHKIPRTRGGSSDEGNWQPLCVECNNFKSTACRGCEAECTRCSWAFPETYAPIRISPDIAERLRSLALDLGKDVHRMLDDIVESHIAALEEK